MGKSVSGSLDPEVNLVEVKELFPEVFIHEEEEGYYTLALNGLYVWCYRSTGEDHVEFKFSKRFNINERINFICYIKSKVNFYIEDADIY